MKKILTLCLVYNSTHLLLGYKKRGFGKGRWNGFGGKVNKGESIEQAAKRELKEEINIEPLNIEKRGVITFQFKESPEILEVHLFSIDKFTGKPKETEEMKPQWFTFDKIPYRLMWPDDRFWLPIMLSGKNFKGKVCFQDLNTILDYEIKEVVRKHL